jgi:hypothetical protein
MRPIELDRAFELSDEQVHDLKTEALGFAKTHLLRKSDPVIRHAKNDRVIRAAFQPDPDRSFPAMGNACLRELEINSLRISPHGTDELMSKEASPKSVSSLI